MTGILLIDKPEGMTSFVAAARVRRMTGVKKTGHTGTLDPMATGVLPVLLGGATRFCELLPSHDKAYTATLRLGTITDTLDITGEVLETREVNVSRAELERALEGFSGDCGYTGVLIALLAGNRPQLVPVAAILYAAAQTGASSMQRQTGVPAAMVNILIGMVVVAILIRGWLAQRGSAKERVHRA